MKFKFYNPVDENGNCIFRSLSLLLNRDYYKVKEDLNGLAHDMNKDYRDIEVFEFYMDPFVDVLDIKDIKVKDLKLGKGRYAIFCFKDDFYYMTSIIDDVLYDKNDESLDLNVTRVYYFYE